MRKTYLLGMSILVAGLLVGCGSSSGSSSSGSTGSSSTAEIATIGDAQQAAAAFSQINTMGSFGSSFGSSFANSAPQRGPSLATIPTQTQNCASGGSMTISGSYSDDGSNFDMKQKYNSCNQGYGSGLMDGSMRVQLDSSGNNIDMKMTMSDLSMVNGSSSYTMDFTMDIDTNTNYNPMTMVLDGDISLVASGYDYKASYNNFRMRTQNQYLNISGKVSMKSNIYSCVNGSYNIETLDDLYISGNGYSTGTLRINGATYTYNGDNTVDVTLANGETSQISQSDIPQCN